MFCYYCCGLENSSQSLEYFGTVATLDFSLGFYIFAIWTVLLLSLILLLIVSVKAR